MPPSNGKYIMSIPLSRLFVQGQGNLAVLPGEFDPEDESKSSTLATILSFVPPDQTAFDALFAVPPTYFEVLEVYPNFRFVTLWVQMTMVVCEIGINQGTAMQLQRLAAGPWPPGRQHMIGMGRRMVRDMLHRLIEIRVEEYGLDDHTRSRAVQCVIDLCMIWGINFYCA